MQESEVYFTCKTLLRRAGINVFGGEPPGGSNDIHRVELKDPANLVKGSRGSRKFDLLAYHLGKFILIELKDDAAKLGPDIEKLNSTLSSDSWIGALWDNLNERGLFGRMLPRIDRSDMIRRRPELFVKALGSPKSAFSPPADFLLFEVLHDRIRCRSTRFTDIQLLEDLVSRLAPYGF